MKLLQLNVTANWGSTGKIAEGIGIAAINHGWESYIAYGRKMNPSQSKLIKVGSNIDVYAHYARNKISGDEGLGSSTATRELVNSIKDIKPDIIHLHNIHDHWLNYPILFRFLSSSDIPVVWTFHDCWAFTGGCAHFEFNNCFQWQYQNCSNCKFGYKNAHNNILNKIKCFAPLANRLHIVSVSSWLNNYVKKSFFKDITSKFHVIHNGIDLNSVFKPGGTKENIILGVSNVWPKSKGLNDFIKLREFLSPEYKIYIVGLRPSQIRNLPQGIVGRERTNSPRELAGLYAKARAFLNPTYNDTFPTVNLEALACGTPVITYKTGGSPEAIDEKTGIVVNQGDIKGLASAVQSIILSDDKYTVEQCRRRAEKLYNKHERYGEYIELYKNILNS